jgi:DGQHR domain-containing protein
MPVYNTVAFKYAQHRQEYISLVLPFEVIHNISKVLVYGDDKYGYQRKLNERHYKTIKKGIVKDKIILPTSIILSVDSDYINHIIKLRTENDSLVDIAFNLSEREFRIVDGQHRIKGLEEASKEDPSVKNFLLNVIILVTEKHNRAVEVEVFRDINSKAKKIKTDLTYLAIHNYELLEHKEIEDLARHLTIKTAY